MFLKLFLTFLEIGAVSFGGGYGMISLIREKVLLNGWLSEAEFLSFIAVSESTPGPLAVNMATFICASQGGGRCRLGGHHEPRRPQGRGLASAEGASGRPA